MESPHKGPVSASMTCNHHSLQETMLLKVEVIDYDPVGSSDYVDFLRLRMDKNDTNLTYREHGHQFMVISRTV